jgi:hypothetical protein
MTCQHNTEMFSRLAEQANQMTALALTQLPDKFYVPPPEPGPLSLKAPEDISDELHRLGLSEALSAELSRVHLSFAERLLEDCNSTFTRTCRSLPFNAFDPTHTSLREAHDAYRQHMTKVFTTATRRQREFLFAYAQDRKRNHNGLSPPKAAPGSPSRLSHSRLGHGHPTPVSIPRKKSRSLPFNSHITSMLEQAMSRTPFPNVGDKRKLAKALGLELKQVSVWVRLQPFPSDTHHSLTQLS